MAKLEVEMDNVSDVFKKKFERAKDALSKIEGVVPPEILKVASQAQEEGKKRLQDILHFLGIPSLKDFKELSKKVDALSKAKKTKTHKAS